MLGLTANTSTGGPIVAGCRALIDALNGAVVAELDGCIRPSPFDWKLDAARFADLDDDGIPEVLTAEGIYAQDGTPWVCLDDWGGPITVVRHWDELHLLGYDSGEPARAALDDLLEQRDMRFPGPPFLHAIPAVTDLDADGDSDVFYVSPWPFDANDHAVVRTDALGGVVWYSRLSGPPAFSSPTLADLGNDGSPEVLVVDSRGIVILDAATGRGLARLEAPIDGHGASLTWADADGDLVPEIVAPETGEAMIRLYEVAGEPPRSLSLDWVDVYGHSPDRVENPQGHPVQRSERASWLPGPEGTNLALTDDRWACSLEADSTGEMVVPIAFTRSGPPLQDDVVTLEFFDSTLLEGWDDEINRPDYVNEREPVFTAVVSLAETEISPGRHVARLRVPVEVWAQYGNWVIGRSGPSYAYEECSWLDNWARVNVPWWE